MGVRDAGRLFLLGQRRVQSDRASFLIGKASFLGRQSVFLIGRASFLVGRASFSVGRASFLIGRAHIFSWRSVVFNGEASFLIGRASFLVGRASVFSWQSVISRLEDVIFQLGRGFHWHSRHFSLKDRLIGAKFVHVQPNRIGGGKLRSPSTSLIGREAIRSRVEETICEGREQLERRCAARTTGNGSEEAVGVARVRAIVSAWSSTASGAAARPGACARPAHKGLDYDCAPSTCGEPAEATSTAPSIAQEPMAQVPLQLDDEGRHVRLAQSLAILEYLEVADPAAPESS